MNGQNDGEKDQEWIDRLTNGQTDGQDRQTDDGYIDGQG